MSILEIIGTKLAKRGVMRVWKLLVIDFHLCIWPSFMQHETKKTLKTFHFYKIELFFTNTIPPTLWSLRYSTALVHHQTHEHLQCYMLLFKSCLSKPYLILDLTTPMLTTTSLLFAQVLFWFLITCWPIKTSWSFLKWVFE